MGSARIGFFTAAFLDGLYEDDQLAANALKAHGFDVRPVIWNEPFDPAHFDALVVRSPWDWFHHRAAFRHFLEGLATLPLPVFNAPQLMMQYADKTYFRSLWSLGIETVPTEFFSSRTLHTLPEVMAQRRWKKAVLKPSFTANALGAVRFDASDAKSAVAQAQHAPSDSEWMLQPFLENVERVGEWSLLFFGGRFSHAVLKRPQRGDFRVQSTHGGVATAAVAPGAMVDVASRIVHVAAPESLYARVDGIEEGGRFLLMELEVVEPDLFFHFEPSAAVRFAECLASKLSDLASAGTTLA